MYSAAQSGKNTVRKRALTPKCHGYQERMKGMKRRQQRRFAESKGEKFKNWVKEKRFYIVLLCCIMAVSATYFVADSLQRSQAPAKPQQESAATPAPTSTPLPDLTKGMQEGQDKITGETQKPDATPAPATDKTSEATPAPEPEPEPAPSPTPDTSEANADADVDYTSSEKTTLTYPVNGEVITPHAVETLIYSKTLGDWRSHQGIDIKAQIGTDVLAAADGIIEDVYTDDFMGITIVIDHQNGLKSVYANLSNASLVQKGQSVTRGAAISAVGDTAIYETGEVGHLHFEVIEDGNAVDPLVWLES